jgi:glycosyltransferase involved in cell wall biosynthesis
MAMPSLRVLHCVAGNLFGGVETLLVTLARLQQLAPAMEPEFVLCFEGRLSDELRRAGAVVHALAPVTFRRPWTVWRTRRGLGRLLATRQLDVVVCHGCWPHLLFGPVVRRADLPLVYWMHDRIGGDHWVERGAARTPPDLTLVNSRGTSETVPRLFPSVPHVVFFSPIAPSVCGGSTTREALRDELATTANAAVIVQVSRLERWKGHMLLLAALARLRVKTDWVAWIAGGAQRPHERVYLAELQAEAQTAGIAARVRFLGERSDIPRLLAAADVFCQPNTGPEPFGAAFVEALYARLPVVSTGIGGAAEIVDESCGRLVPPDDSSALAETLTHLIDDPTLRQRLGAAGPARARRLCDPETRLPQLETLLRDLSATTRLR